MKSNLTFNMYINAREFDLEKNKHRKEQWKIKFKLKPNFTFNMYINARNLI